MKLNFKYLTQVSFKRRYFSGCFTSFTDNRVIGKLKLNNKNLNSYQIIKF
jgi:hypothetical protein